MFHLIMWQVTWFYSLCVLPQKCQTPLSPTQCDGIWKKTAFPQKDPYLILPKKPCTSQLHEFFAMSQCQMALRFSSNPYKATSLTWRTTNQAFRRFLEFLAFSWMSGRTLFFFLNMTKAVFAVPSRIWILLSESK